MSTYPQFYREVGVRQQGHFNSPRVKAISDIRLPRDSIAHFYTDDDIAYGPDSHSLLLLHYDQRILVEHIGEFIEPIGDPITDRGVRLTQLRQDYHRRHRKLRIARDFERAIRDPSTLLVENYAMLNHLYRYRRSIYATFYKWYNITNTLLNNAVEKTQGNERQHFISIDLPEELIHPRFLNLASVPVSEFSRRQFDTYANIQQLIILEIWKLLGGNQQISAFKNATLDRLDRLNFIFHTESHYSCLNIGHMIRIFYDSLDELTEDEASGIGNIAQRSFMRYLISMQHYRSVSVDEQDNYEEQVDEIDDDIDDTQQKIKQSAEDQGVDDEQLERDLEQLQKIQERAQKTQVEYQSLSTRERIREKIARRAESGRLTPAQAKRLERLLDNSAQIENPFGEGTIDEFRQISDEELQISEEDRELYKPSGVVDESMAQSTLKSFDKKYIEKVLDKDIANAIMGIENAGVIVRDIEREEHKTISDHYHHYKLRIQPVDGEASTIEFKIPVIREDGTMLTNGNTVRMKKQRNDQPIRKVRPDSVALTSYYAKHFVNRSNKKVVNYPHWIQKQIVEIAYDNDDSRVSSIKHIETFDHKLDTPRIYSILAQRFRSIEIEGNTTIYVDYHHRKEHFGAEQVERVENASAMLFAGISDSYPIVVGDDNVFYKISEQIERLGTIEELIGLDRKKAPIEIAEFKSYARSIPAVFALGFHYGLSGLIERIGATHRSVIAGERLQLAENEYAVRFSDETLIFDRDEPLASIIFAGLNRYHSTIINYPRAAFDRQEVYTNVFEENGFKVGFVRELGLSFEMFVDPITEDLLKQMGEPTTLDGLIIRSCELLLSDKHPKETDMQAMLIRGYERIAGNLYKNISSSVRSYRARGVGTNARIEMNPEAVFQQIIQDPSVILVENTNPIHNLKQSELVSYTGIGGRSRLSMVRRTRVYHDSDIGVTSESTVDSGEVGVNAYLSANPQLINLRGQTALYDPETTGPSSLISTSALNAPATEYDDPKRINFIGIQNTHVVAQQGARPMPLRTGYEKMLAHRAGSMYAHVSSGEGTIRSVDDDLLIIDYDDGSVDHVEIGRRYGDMQGTTIPHDIVTDFEAGQRVHQGDVVAFNSGFFQRDFLDPRQVLYKEAVLAKTAIVENSFTWEDASAISERLASSMKTTLTEKRAVAVHFSQEIRNLPKIGDELDLETILCTIEDPVGEETELDDTTAEILELMKTNAPRAKISGHLDNIELYYRGEKELMSKSLKKLADYSDKRLKERAEKRGEEPVTGRVYGNTRIAKRELSEDSAVIVFYITHPVEAGIGDKGVFGNQMKSVFANVMTGTNETESGEPIDALFSYLSIANRIVLSPEVMGTTNTLLRKMSKIVANEYFGES